MYKVSLFYLEKVIKNSIFVNLEFIILIKMKISNIKIVQVKYLSTIKKKTNKHAKPVDRTRPPI